jgi:diguanylate cyclase (GGDEF)-like protein
MERQQQPERRRQILEQLIADSRTGLYDSRHLDFWLDAEIARSRRYGYGFSLVLLDLDHFKTINDAHGHRVGYTVLADVGGIPRANCRVIDMAFRYGGDEFVILLPQTSKNGGCRAALNSNRLTRNYQCKALDGVALRITASVGCAAYPNDSLDGEELLDLADKAMHHVKHTKRDGAAAANRGILPLP